MHVTLRSMHYLSGQIYPEVTFSGLVPSVKLLSFHWMFWTPTNICVCTYLIRSRNHFQLSNLFFSSVAQLAICRTCYNLPYCFFVLKSSWALWWKNKSKISELNPVTFLQARLQCPQPHRWWAVHTVVALIILKEHLSSSKRLCGFLSGNGYTLKHMAKSSWFEDGARAGCWRPGLQIPRELG